MLNNIEFFLQKSNDPTGLLKDIHFKNMLKQMISAKAENRSNISKIIDCEFIKANNIEIKPLESF